MSTPTRRVTRHAAPRPAITDWREYAVCRQVDPELFFPIPNSTAGAIQARDAKRVCGTCPVRRKCLSWALKEKQDIGVLGGLTEEERAAIHGRRAERRTSTDGRPAWQVIVESRLGEYRALEAAGMSAWEIGRRMRTNAQTIHRVRDELAKAQKNLGVAA